MTTRRGFTLIELMIGLVVMLIVGAALQRVLVTSQRVSRAQVAQTNLQSNVRSGALVLVNELREIGYDSATDRGVLAAVTDFRTDLLRMDNDTIRYRAMRGFGVVCDYNDGEVRLRKPLYSYRSPVESDVVLIFADHNLNLAADDEFFRATVNGPVTDGTCSTGGDALLVPIDPGGIVAGAWGVIGGPARISEVMEMGLYVAADGKRWIGARSVSRGEESFQPLLGPLQAGGLIFEYRDNANNTTTDPRMVRTIDIEVRGEGDGKTTLSGGSNMSTANLNLRTRVALRNAVRP